MSVEDDEVSTAGAESVQNSLSATIDKSYGGRFDTEWRENFGGRARRVGQLMRSAMMHLACRLKWSMQHRH